MSKSYFNFSERIKFDVLLLCESKCVRVNVLGGDDDRMQGCGLSNAHQLFGSLVRVCDHNTGIDCRTTIFSSTQLLLKLTLIQDCNDNARLEGVVDGHSHHGVMITTELSNHRL